jgi:hypothetical protein
MEEKNFSIYKVGINKFEDIINFLINSVWKWFISGADNREKLEHYFNFCFVRIQFFQ